MGDCVGIAGRLIIMALLVSLTVVFIFTGDHEAYWITWVSFEIWWIGWVMFKLPFPDLTRFKGRR